MTQGLGSISGQLSHISEWLRFSAKKLPKGQDTQQKTSQRTGHSAPA